MAEGFNYLPGNKKGLLRLLKKDTGSLLDKEIDIGNYGLRGLPLWYILEKSYSDKNEENALKALHF
ncbi:MAG: hypothetical protein ACPG5P_05760, partial [Saprospiraceae bacterium]